MRVLVFLITFLYSTTLFAQQHPFGFTQKLDIPVFHHNELLAKAWGGGANSLYFSEIDLNLDGVKDLVAFEKHGNRILPFLYIENGDEAHYQFAPQYQYNFPAVHDWMMLKDYDGDGKEDIFTYGLASITIYKNTSTNTLQFELITETLLSNYFGSDVNLFASPDDYLGIYDIDDDGDLDLLNFWVLGQNLHLQENAGNGNSDIPHLDFHVADECWGKFSEAADGNELTLLTNCENKMQKNDSKHIGSSIFLHDFNHDELVDIVIGDVDYPSLNLLINGGTNEEAIMVSQTTDFPNAVNPILFYSMPAFNLIDINHDGIDEIVASPSDPSFIKSIDKNSVWMYSYQDGEYALETTSFLQDEMIDVGSGAIPIFYDWNQDNMLDLFIANYGSYDTTTIENGFVTSLFYSSISYYKNIGNENIPQFELVTDDFGNLRSLETVALYPTFGDLNNDGKIDLLCGNSKGDLLFFENTNSDETPHFLPPQSNYFNIDVGDYSTPQWFDLNLDGKTDLLIGNRRGIIAAYENVGTTSQPELVKRTDTLGGVDVRNFNFSYHGYATPCFYRNGNTTTLFCGAEDGYIYIYNNIPNTFDAIYNPKIAMVETISNNTHWLKSGARTAPAVANLTQNNYPDMVIGNWAGGLSYFQGSEPHPVSINEENHFAKKTKITLYPNPTTSSLTINIENAVAEKVMIYDILGVEKMRVKNASSEYQINCEQLPTGFYVVKVIIDGKPVVRKLVKR